MASRALLLAFVTTAFAAAWSGDQREQERLVASRMHPAARARKVAANKPWWAVDRERAASARNAGTLRQ